MALCLYASMVATTVHDYFVELVQAKYMNASFEIVGRCQSVPSGREAV
jgi:hypothetical protein